jgi:hypothetical protein
LTAAAEAGKLSRSISVLAAGREDELILDDLSLKTHYSARHALKHAATMNSLMASHLASLYPGTSFIHMSPGVVKTNMLDNMGFPGWFTAPVMVLLTPFCVPIKESGERYLYAATSSAYAPKDRQGDMKEARAGSYLLEWDNREVGNDKMLKRYREEGRGGKGIETHPGCL